MDETDAYERSLHLRRRRIGRLTAALGTLGILAGIVVLFGGLVIEWIFVFSGTAILWGAKDIAQARRALAASEPTPLPDPNESNTD